MIQNILHVQANKVIDHYVVQNEPRASISLWIEDDSSSHQDVNHDSKRRRDSGACDFGGPSTLQMPLDKVGKARPQVSFHS